MTAPYRKKLIEVSIPLEAINVASAREKSIRHGHPSTLHLWWARRPLAACRAVLFAQLVDDPSAWPGRYPFPEIANDEESERRRLHGIIQKMVPWEATNDEAILNEARWEIARSFAWGLGEDPPPRGDGKAILQFLQAKAPPVYDPFSGGASIPLEAQRLGLRARGSDLNPVAVLIGKALVEIPPNFAGRPPVNPVARAEFKRGGSWNGKGAQGLAADVRHYGQWMRDEAEKRIGHLYPKATLSDGREATVIAWLWARTVRSPDPAAKGAMVPLVSSFILSSKEGKKAWVEVVIDPGAPHGWRFEVKSGHLLEGDEERLKQGTKTSRGNFSCVLTGAAISAKYIRSEGIAGRISERLMAIVAQGRKGISGVFGDEGQKGEGRVYLTPNDLHQQSSENIEPAWVPEGELYEHALGFRVPAYGMKRWADLFTHRQLTALTVFSDLVTKAREKVEADAREAGFSDDPTPLHQNGRGSLAYSHALATYLAFSVTNISDRNASIVGWASNREHARNVFTRQALSMVWDFAESNVFSDSSGNFEGGVEKVARVLDDLYPSPAGEIRQESAQANTFNNSLVVISTDPPYYDNIGYADLSDFFYVWLKPSLLAVWPDLFRRLSTPKTQELVATPHRHGGKDGAEEFFMKGMREALHSMFKASAEAPLAIYYAFKQSESADDGVTSAGWASFLQAVVDSGLAVDGTWPMRTELARRVRGQQANALASSVVLVCRKRPELAPSTDRAGFTAALRRDLPDAIAKIRAAGVGPVDMQQSVIGPGMGVFTRYAEVLEDDDSRMPVRTVLAIVNRVFEELDGELVASLDAETQVALAWFGSYGFEAKPSGELIGMATAKDTSMNVLFDSGVFQNLHGKAALMPRDKLPTDWTPSRDRHLTVWECVQHTARVLNDAEAGGQDAAASLVAEMGAMATDARALLDRLFRIATEKGWASEALVYNQLAEEWPRLLDRAPAVKPAAPETPDMFAAG